MFSPLVQQRLYVVAFSNYIVIIDTFVTTISYVAPSAKPLHPKKGLKKIDQLTFLSSTRLLTYEHPNSNI